MILDRQCDALQNVPVATVNTGGKGVGKPVDDRRAGRDEVPLRRSRNPSTRPVRVSGQKAGARVAHPSQSARPSTAFIGALTLATTAFASAQAPLEADNTKVNARDRQKGAVTPINRKTTSRIARPRRRFVAR